MTRGHANGLGADVPRSTSPHLHRLHEIAPSVLSFQSTAYRCYLPIAGLLSRSIVIDGNTAEIH